MGNATIIKQLQDKGFCRVADRAGMEGALKMVMDSAPTITPNNIGMPAGILTNILQQNVRVLLTERSADLVIGEKRAMLAFTQNNIQVPVVEQTGTATPYADFNDPASTGINLTFNNVNQHRFATKVSIGDLEQGQVAHAGIDLVSMQYSAATEIIAREQNYIAYNGYVNNSSNVWTCYGLFNNPDLSNYETIAKEWGTATWEEIVNDIRKLIGLLINQSGGRVKSISKMKLALPPEKKMRIISLLTSLGVNPMEQFKSVFPNLELVEAYEMRGAYTGGKDVCYLICEDVVGELPVMTQGISELGRMSRVEYKHNGYSQQVIGGTLGCVVFYPWLVVRAQGL